MSRSYREPCNGNSDGSKHWKQKANRKIRRDAEQDIGSGNQYRRKSDVWDSPMENKKAFWGEEKLRRK